MTNDERIEHAAKILRSVLDVPVAERLDVLAMALRVAIDNGILTNEGDPTELLKRRYGGSNA